MRSNSRKVVRMADSSRSRNSGSAPRKKVGAESAEHRWTFLSNHAHVLICLAQDPYIRLREVADLIGITERAVQKILSDLEAEGLVERYKEGRRNSYELHLDQPLRHPVEKHRNVGDLVNLIVD
mgnify:CR=1 FL=1